MVLRQREVAEQLIIYTDLVRTQPTLLFLPLIFLSLCTDFSSHPDCIIYFFSSSWHLAWYILR